MNKLIVCVALTLLAATSFSEVAEAKKDSRPKLTSEQYRERTRQVRLRRHGGVIRKQGSAHGKVVILNAQKRVSDADIRPAVEEIDRSVHPIIELSVVSQVSAANPNPAIKAAGGNLGVAVVDEEAVPALMVAPEEGWAVVNVKPLAQNALNDAQVASRVRKEIMRGFAFIGGAAFMTRDPVVFRGDVRSAKDLDLIKEESYGVDALAALEKNLPMTGVVPWKQATYKKACKEGWAPAPTNEYERAIWEKVNAIPSNPIKIKYDPKVGK